MTVALIIVSTVAAAVVVSLAVLAWHLRDRIRELELRADAEVLVGRTVVINTRRPDDQTFRGILHGQYADRWTLRDAVTVTGVGEQAAGGLVHVPVANIAFVQEIEG